MQVPKLIRPNLIFALFAQVFLICTQVQELRAQSFDKQGLYTPKAGNNSLYTLKKLPANPAVLPVFVGPTITQAQSKDNKNIMDGYNKQLLARINTTINNLKDDSLHLKSIYDEIWPGTYVTYLKNLQAVKDYLEKHTGTATDPDLPTQNDIDQLGNLDLFGIRKDDQLTTGDLLVYDLIQKDALATWLYDKYKADHDADLWVKDLKMNMDYINEWRELEGLLQQIKDVQSWTKSRSDNIFKFDTNEYEKIKHNLDTVQIDGIYLVKKIKASTFLEKWLWYEGGIPSMNPLQVTTDDQKYPYSERNTYFSADKKKIQDTLDKSGLLMKFGQKSKYYNLLTLPQRSQVNQDSIYLLEYNAQNSYKAFDPVPDNTLDRGFKLSLAIYNVSSTNKLIVKSTYDSLLYMSPLVQTAKSLFDQLAIITALGSGDAAIAAKLTASINQPDFQNVPLRIPSQANALTSQKVESTDLNGHTIPLTGKNNEDKKRILLTAALQPNNVSSNHYNPFYEKVVDEFVKEDESIFLNLSNGQAFANSRNALIQRFNNFQAAVDKHIKLVKDLNTEAAAIFKKLDPYIRICNRSLPPTKLDISVDTIPVFRTIVNTPTTPAAPKKLIVKVTEQTAQGKSAGKEVINQPLNIIQTQRFDFSFGIGYTFPNYYVSSPGTPLPTSKLGDHFQFLVGAHWYFWRRLNKLHDGFIDQYWRERFSFYAGLSIEHALDNYYTGLSYDVVPGVRIISGAHFYKNYHFKILNNSIADQASGISYAGVFVSLNLEPIVFGKAIGLFK